MLSWKAFSPSLSLPPSLTCCSVLKRIDLYFCVWRDKTCRKKPLDQRSSQLLFFLLFSKRHPLCPLTLKFPLVHCIGYFSLWLSEFLCHNHLCGWCIIAGMDEHFQSPMWICYCTTANWVIPSAPVSLSVAAFSSSYASISDSVSTSLSFKAAGKAFKPIFSYTHIWKFVPSYWQAVAEMIILYSATFNEINCPSLQELLIPVLLEM